MHKVRVSINKVHAFNLTKYKDVSTAIIIGFKIKIRFEPTMLGRSVFIVKALKDGC